jgi:ABC-type nitrate/sulfonate/bicarbonate transport system substrate-binding protein
MDKLRFPYRAAGHLALLHIVNESGAWKKQGLSVEYDSYVGPQEAHEFLRSGKAEFISGNHITPYIARAEGDDWIYLGQTANYVAHSIVVGKKSKIKKLEDLKGKSLAIDGKGGPHIWLNGWLILKKNGLEGAVNVKRIYSPGPAWKAVQSGDEEAALVSRPQDLIARREGLGVITLPLLPMIVFTTVSTTATFARENGPVIYRFLKGLADGIKFVKSEKKRSIEILNSTLPKERGGGDKEIVQYLHKDMMETLSPTLYPTMEALSNVYAEACRYGAAAKKVNPLELWDLHYLRDLRDRGEI